MVDYIVRVHRSGSSFLGEILASLPGSFYSFEPLAYFDLINKDATNQMEVKHFLDNVLKCQVEEDFFQVLQENVSVKTESIVAASSKFLQPSNHHLVRRNERLWVVCSDRHQVGNENLCFSSDFVNAACKFFPVHVVKLNRVEVATLGNVLEEHFNVKLVVLVRDPRGVMVSR